MLNKVFAMMNKKRKRGTQVLLKKKRLKGHESIIGVPLKGIQTLWA